MSFTTDIKSELCHVPVADETALAECLGMLLFAGQFSRENLRIQCEMPAVRHRVLQLMNRYMDLWPEEQDTILQIRDPQEIARIFGLYGFERESSLPLNRALVEDEQSRSAFLRGAFLIGGYVSTPEKGYHLELVTPHYHAARQVSSLLGEMELTAGYILRRGIHVLYYKDSAAIEEFLSACGATGAAMDLMLKKVEREFRNDINRKVNCETANLTKTVGAAARQIAAIEKLQESGVLENLPENLRQTAFLRLANPEMSLTELVAAANGSISRPGLNNRLRRLVQLAEEAEK
ncbi:MAG: DNA-binding protein WhiA [Clostridia bacterium]|nr:DNA-binding protein WhiA [Clostridia bacterium]